VAHAAHAQGWPWVEALSRCPLLVVVVERAQLRLACAAVHDPELT